MADKICEDPRQIQYKRNVNLSAVYVFKRVSPKSIKAKDTVLLHPVKTMTRGNWPRYYAMTEEGYIINELWIEIIGAFINLIQVHLHDSKAEESAAEKGARKKAKITEESSDEEPSPEISPGHVTIACHSTFK